MRGEVGIGVWGKVRGSGRGERGARGTGCGVA